MSLFPPSSQSQPSQTQSLSVNPVQNEVVIRYLTLNDIKRHELDITIPVRKQIETYRNVAKNDPASLPVLRVGQIDNGEYHLLADTDAYMGAMEAGIITAKCQIDTCTDESDLLIRHVRYNCRPVGCNPLLLKRIADYLSCTFAGTVGNSGLVEDILQVRDTVYQKFLSLEMDSEARSILVELCTYLGTRLTQFVLPYYIPHMISKHDTEQQATQAQRISELVRARPVTDARFAWPSPEEVSIMLSSLQADVGETDICSGSSNVTITGDRQLSSLPTTTARAEQQTAAVMAAPTTETTADEPATITPNGDLQQDETRHARNLFKNQRDILVIPATKTPTLVDLRTRRVSTVNEMDIVTVLRDIETKTVPSVAVDMLNIHDDEAINIAKFDSIEDLEEFGRRHPDIRGVILYK